MSTVRVAGASFVQTPHLDGLAERGVWFSQCITNAPLCVPARVGLASGCQPLGLGCLSNDSALPQRVPTYYQRLRDAGYQVGCVGKLDLARSGHTIGRGGNPSRAYEWGFTQPFECEGKIHASISEVPQGPYGGWLEEQGLYGQFRADYKQRAATDWINAASHDSVLPAEAHADVYIGQQATHWIETVTDDVPWFLFVSFVGPHPPFDPPTEYADQYRTAAVPAPIPDPLRNQPPWLRTRQLPMTAEEVAHTRRQYCASIALIDEQIGRILGVLEQRGMRGQTYVIFASDHGEMLGDYGLYRKSVPHEQALRVPLIVAGPKLSGGRRSDACVELIDLNPTICELAGLRSQPKIDAVSFHPILSGYAETHRTETVSALERFRVIRSQDYKFIQYEDAPLELYNIQHDPEELHNIADTQPTVVRQLSQRLLERLMAPPLDASAHG